MPLKSGSIRKRIGRFAAALCVLAAACVPVQAANPSAVTDLTESAVVSTGLGADSMTVTLTWSAPSDGEGDAWGAGCGFHIAYSTVDPITNDTEYDSANYLVEIATSGIGEGDLQTYSFSSLDTATTHYFVIKTTNTTAGERSSLSNGATAQSYVVFQEGSGGDSIGAAWGDYDRDGDLDLVVANANAEDGYLLRNDGTSAFAKVTMTGSAGNSRGIAWGDYDNDGDLDLAVANTGVENTYLLRNDGAGSFGKIDQAGSGGNSFGIAWGDYDNDGDLDLALGNSGEDIYFLRNDGTDTFAKVTQTGSGGSSYGIAWGDYDGDGDLDLAVANAGGEDIYLLRNDGTDVFAKVTQTGSGGDSRGIAWGDYDADGDLDLAVTNIAGEDNYFLRNDGTEIFAKVTQTGSGGTSFGSLWGDYDVDGDLDLAVTNIIGEDAYLLRNDGTDNFSKVDLAGTGGSSYGNSWGDYDDDGDLDLFVANYSAEDAYLIRNDTPAVNTVPSAPSSGFMASFSGYDEFSSSGVLTIEWGDGSDTETSDPDVLQYFVRLGLTGVSGSSDVYKVPERYGLDGFSGGGSFLYSTWLSTSPRRRGMKVVLQKETTAHWAVVTEDSGFMRSPESVEQSTTVTGPNAVTDLAVVSIVSTGLGASSMTVRLSWTAPGDDGDAGAIAGGEYEIRYSTLSVIDSTDAFVNAPAEFRITIATSVSPGEAQYYDLPYLDASTSHYFAITTKDGVGVRSWLSNAATAQAYILGLGIGGDTDAIVWGDYDGDGDLDFAAGNDGDEVIGKNNGDGTFSTFTVTVGGANTMGVAWGDYDSDGDLDLALANATSDEILRNDGSDTFVLAVTLPGTNAVTRGIAWGDYDNDGDLDFAATGADTYVAVNSGGSFSTFTVAGMGAGEGLAWADYDEDGDLDFAIAKDAGTVFIARNDGNDSFYDYSVAATAGNTRSVAWGDFDNDGDLDIAVAVSAADDVILDYQGGTTFGTTAISGTTDARGVAAGDYDNDGDLDLLMTLLSGGDEYLLVNNGGLSFTRVPLPGIGGETVGASWGDFDDDGDLDLILGNQGTEDGFIVRNDTDVAHAAPSPPTVPVDSFSEYSIFSTSGVLTLQWTDSTDDQTSAQSMNYYLRVGTTVAGSSTTMSMPPRFSAGGWPGQSDSPYSTRISPTQRGINLVMQKETTVYWTVVAEDGERQRSGEIAEQVAYLAAPSAVSGLSAVTTSTGLAASSMTVTLSWVAPGNNGMVGNIGSGGEYEIRYSTTGVIDTEQKFIDAPAEFRILIATSVNPGDPQYYEIPYLDAATTHYFAITTKDHFGVRSGLSNPTTAQAVYYFLPGSGTDWVPIAWGDFDNDGDLDFGVGHRGSVNSFGTNNGDGTFTIASLSDPSRQTWSLALADMDNDGDLDLAAGNAAGADEHVLRNEGDATYTSSDLTGTGADSFGIAWGDYDNDGDFDLGVGNYGQEDYIATNDGAGGFSTFTLVATSSDAFAAAWGDCDNDGDLDLAVANYDEDDYIAKNNGDGTFSLADLTNSGTLSQSIAWGDYDGDGDLDLAIGKNGDDMIMENGGNCSFTDNTLTGSGGDSEGVLWLDFDNDGDLDLVATHLGGAVGALFENTDGLGSLSRHTLPGPNSQVRSASAGDYDGDGDLDLIVTDDAMPTRVMRNDISVAHTSPTAPGAPTASYAPYETFASSGILTIQWSDGSDGETTDTDLLEYYVRVGTGASLSSTTLKIPARYATDGASGGSYLYSTRLGGGQRGIKLAVSAETTYYFAAVTVDLEGMRSGESTEGEAWLTAPAPITDLAASQDTSVETSSVAWAQLTFRSPGEDGTAGNLQASSIYDIRWTTAGAIDTEAKYLAAYGQAQVSAQGTADQAGTQRLVAVEPGYTYYFAMTTVDQYGSRSGLSNSASFTPVVMTENVVGVAPTFALQGETTAFLMITLQTGAGTSVDWSKLKVTKRGTLPNSAIQNVAVFRDANGDGRFVWSDDGSAVLTDPATFSGDDTTIDFSSPWTVNDTPQNFFVGIQFDPDYLPVENSTIAVSLDGQAFTITGGGVDSVDFPALNLDGADDRVTAPYNLNNSLEVSAVTLEAWVRTTDNGADRSIVTRGDDSGGYRLWLNGGIPVFYVGSAAMQAQLGGAPQSVDDGQWHHVAASYGAEGRNIFIDGQAMDDAAVSGNLSNTKDGVGVGGSSAAVGGLGNFLAGEIDEVRISNTVRYSSSTMFDPARRHAFDANAVVLYRFGADIGGETVVADASNGSNTGALMGSATGYGRSDVTALEDGQDILIASGTDITPSVFYKNSQNVPLMKLELWTESDYVTIDSLLVRSTGTGDPNGLSNVRIYLDDGDEEFQEAQDTSLVPGQVFSGGTATFDLQTNGVSQTVGSSTKTYFLTWNVLSGAQAGFSLGLQLGATSDFVLSGSTDAVSTTGFPHQSSTRTVVPAEALVFAEVSTSSWVNISSIVFNANFDYGNVSYFCTAWDNVSDTSVGSCSGSDRWSVGKATTTGSPDGNTWYFHAKAFDSFDQPGTQLDFGPFWSDRTLPSGSGYATFGSSAIALTESSFNDLAADVTAQLDVADTLSGLNLDGPSPLADSSGTGALWRFEETAAPWLDESHNGNSLTVGAGTPVRGPGRFAAGMLFDGASDLQNASPSGLPLGGAPRTVEAWIAPRSTQGVNGIMSWGTAGGPTRIALVDGKLAAGFSASLSSAGPVLSTGVWQHVAFAFDGSDGRFYVDGQEVGSDNFAGVNTQAGTLYVGGMDTLEKFEGEIDELRVFGDVRSADEIYDDHGRGDPYSVSYSTDAGNTWRVVSSTVSASDEYLWLDGTHGASGPSTFKVFGLDLVSSTSTDTGDKGTNQVRFHFTDLAGNLRTQGPFAVLVDTNMPVAMSTQTLPAPDGYTTTKPDFHWTGPSSSIVAGIDGEYFLQVADDQNFTNVIINITTPAVVTDAQEPKAEGAYISTFTLSENTTFYWRVLARSYLGVSGPWSGTASFVTDLTSPAASGFGVVNSTGGFLAEGEPLDLLTGVTAQFLLQDGTAGLSRYHGVQSIGGTVGLWHFSEKEAGPKDASGTNADASLACGGVSCSSATYILSPFGAGVRCDNGQGVTLPNTQLNFAAGSDYTIEAWIKPDSVSGFRVITGVGSISAEANYVFRIQNSTLSLSNDTGVHIGLGAVVQAGVWQHVAVTAENDHISFYIDGVLKSAGVSGAGGNSGPGAGPANMPFSMCTGIANSGTWDGQYAGGIDELRILNYAADAAAIADTYSKSRQGRFAIEYSTDAGNNWIVISSTDPVPGGYITLSGVEGSVNQETLVIRDLVLDHSTSPATGASATNQIRVSIPDRAGNWELAGPFGVVTDTVAAAAVSTPSYPVAGEFVGVQPNFGWRGPSTTTIVSMGGGPIYLLEVDNDNDFVNPVISISTPVIMASTMAERSRGFYASTFTLTEGSTYFWRVRARDFLGLYSLPLTVESFVVDVTSPNATSFVSYNSTGGAVGEAIVNDLILDVTAEVRVDDSGSGLQLSSVDGVNTYGVIYTTNGADAIVYWKDGDWAEAFIASGETSITELEVYAGNLYAGSAASGKIYRYDGSDWTEIQNLGSEVLAMKAFQGKLYVGLGGGGEIHTYDGSWSQVADLPDSQVNDFEEYQGRLYAATGELGVGGEPGRVYGYDPDSGAWYEAYTTGDDALLSMEVYNGRLFMGGNPLVYDFDGSSWAPTEMTLSASFLSMQAYDGKLYTGVNFNGLIYEYDGSAWTQAADFPGGDNEIRAMGVHDGRLYVGSGDPSAGAVYTFDGKDWLIVRRFANANDRVNSYAEFNGRLYTAFTLNGAQGQVYVSTPITVNLTGSDGTQAVQTFTAEGLNLEVSGNSNTCGALPGCTATNQVRFTAMDRAGNSKVYGPFAMLTDTLLAQPTAQYPADGSYVRFSQPSVGWIEPSTMPYHNVQISTVADFSVLSVDVTTDTQYLTTDAALQDSATYFWQVRSLNSLSIPSAFSSTKSFVLDYVAPTTSAYTHVNSTGALFDETQMSNIAVGVTAYMTVQDTTSGMALQPAPDYSRVGAWRFEEEAGSAAYDAFGRSSSGTLVSGVQRTEGAYGRGLAFRDTINDYVDIPYTTRPSGWGGLTAMAWVKPNLVNTSSKTIWASSQFRMQANTSNGLVYYAVDATAGGGCGLTSARIYPRSVWTHVAFVMTPGGNRLYVNGEQVDSCGGGGTPADTGFRVGHDGLSGIGTDDPFSGGIDEAQLYATGLSQTDVIVEMREPRYFVTFSTDSGVNWRAVGSTSTSAGAYLYYTGSDGSTAAETLMVEGLQLTESTNTDVCGGSDPCGATNQLRFHYADRAGNVTQAGPYAVLIDTSVPLPIVSSLTPLTTRSIYVTIAGSDNIAGVQGFQFETSTAADFTGDLSSTPYISQATWTFTGLVSATTYYFRTRVRDNLMNVSTPSVVTSTSTFGTVFFATDTVIPASALQNTVVPMIGFTLASAEGTSKFYGLVVQRTGTAADADVTQAEIWEDDGDAVFESGSDTPLNSTAFSGGVATIQLGASARTLDVAKSTFFLVYQMSAEATVNETVGAELTSAPDVLLKHPHLSEGPFPASASPIPITDGPNSLEIAPLDIAPSGATPGSQDVPLLRLTSQTDIVATSIVDAVTVKLTGTLAPNQVTAVKFWRDANSNGTFEAASDDLLTDGQDGFDVNGISTMTMTAVESSRTVRQGGERFFITASLGAGAPQGDAFQVQVSSQGDVVLDNPVDEVVFVSEPVLSSTVSVVQNNVLSVEPEDLVPATFLQGQTYAVMKATLTVDVGFAEVNRIQVDRSGTAQNSDVSGVSIFRDQTIDGGPFTPGVDVLIGSGTFTGLGQVVVDITTQTINAGTTNVYFIVYELSAGAFPGRDLGVSMANSGYFSAVDPLTAVSGPFPISTTQGAIQAMVNEMLIPVADSVVPGNLEQGQANVPMIRMNLLSDNNDFTWSALKVRRVGTSSFTAVSAVKVFLDDGTQTNVLDAGDTQITGNGDSFNAADLVDISLTSPQTITASTQTYFVTISVANDAVPGDTLGVEIASTTAFTLSAPNTVDDEVTTIPVVAGPRNITQFPNTVSVTTASIVPQLGSEPGLQNIGMMKLELNTDVSDASWTSLKIDQVGSVADSEISAVKVYYDLNDTGNWNSSNLANYVLVSSSEQVFGEASPGTVAIDFYVGTSTPPTITPTAKRYFVVVDLSTTAAPTRTVQLRAINNTYFGVNAPNQVGATSFLSEELNVNAPPEQLYVLGIDSAPANVTQGDTNVAMLTLKTWMSAYTGEWTRLTVSRTGAGLDSDVPRVKLFYDLNDNGILEPVSDTRLSTAGFSGGSAILDFSTQTISASTKTYFVTYDFDTTAVAGNTVGAALGAAGALVVAAPNSVASAGFPVQSSLSNVQATQTNLYVQGISKAPGELVQSATNQILLSLRLYTTQHAVLWSGLTITSTGTATDPDIAAVHIWHDLGLKGVLEPGTDREITSGLNGFLGRTAVVSLVETQTIGTTYEEYLVTVDVADYAVPGSTFGIILETTGTFSVSSPNQVMPDNFPIRVDPVPLKKLAEDLVVTPVDVIPAGINQGSMSIVGKLNLHASRDKVVWTQQRIAKTGTLSDAEVTEARIYRDIDGDGAIGSSDLLVGSDTFSTGQTTIIMSSAQTVGLTTQTYLVAFEFDINATVDATVGFTLSDTFFTVDVPDGTSGDNLPFSSGLATILDAKTPSKPIVTVDGEVSSNFEYLHFTWESTVDTGTITEAFYCVGTAPGGTDVQDWLSLGPTETDVNASGFALVSGTTYYVSVKTKATADQVNYYTSPVGTSVNVLMDFTEPDPPTPNVTTGGSTLLITWGSKQGGPSGIMGYLVEYRTGEVPVWYNAKTRSAAASVSARSYRGAAVRTLAVSSNSVVTGNSYQASGLPQGTLFVRMRTVSASSVVSDPSTPVKVQLGALPKDGITDASNYPNPFDSREEDTTFHYVASADADVTIKIYSVFGRLIREMTFAAGASGGQSGSNEVTWDGTDETGRKVSKGIYIAVIQSGGAKTIVKVGVKH